MHSERDKRTHLGSMPRQSLITKKNAKEAPRKIPIELKKNRWAVDHPPCVAMGVDVKQNREPRRTSPFPFVAGREARYERDAQAHIRSHSNARPTSLPVSDGHSPLSHHARWRKTKSAPCHKPRSEARRGRRRRDTSKPTTHTSGSHRRSSRRIKRRPDPTSASRDQSAPLPCLLHFTPTQGGSRFTVPTKF